MRATQNRRGRKRYAMIRDKNDVPQYIHLGRVGSGAVSKAQKHIRAIVKSHTTGAEISAETQEWLDYTSTGVRKRLAQLGLIHVDEID